MAHWKNDGSAKMQKGLSGGEHGLFNSCKCGHRGFSNVWRYLSLDGMQIERNDERLDLETKKRKVATGTLGARF